MIRNILILAAFLGLISQGWTDGLLPCDEVIVDTTTSIIVPTFVRKPQRLKPNLDPLGNPLILISNSKKLREAPSLPKAAIMALTTFGQYIEISLALSHS